MKSKGLIFIIIALSMILLMGCNKKYGEEIEDEILKKEEEDVFVEKKEGIVSPLSGLYDKKEKLERRPVAIMFDNHPKARWQSGLSQAEIVYEFMVEGPYTRYMGIFLGMDPESIGPVRSARPYFISTLLEYDPIYVRVGGSVEAKKDIINFDIADIDGLSCPNRVLWRNTKVNKLAPHNTYTSMAMIRNYQEEKGYRTKGDYRGFEFYEGDRDLDGFSSNEISIDYHTNNNTLYKYDNEENLYYRYKDGQEHIDELDNSRIKAKNIIIQEAKTKVIDSEGRLKIDLIGQGKGKYMTNGKGIPISWSKKSRNSKTYYYDELGKEIILNPGNTWIQVVDIDPSINIE